MAGLRAMAGGAGLEPAMAGGAGLHGSHRAESAGYQKHSEGTRKVNAPARASLKLGADGPAACSTGEATRMPPRPTADVEAASCYGWPWPTATGQS
jgi:hypothetical protein